MDRLDEIIAYLRLGRQPVSRDVSPARDYADYLEQVVKPQMPAGEPVAVRAERRKAVSA